MKSAVLAIVLTLLAATAALAQNRVFVSAAHGDDTADCSVTTPCRSFAHAMAVVTTAGEILALDSGGYGPVSITRPVSIVAPPGVEASITQTGAGLNAININVTNAFTTVMLRGLSLFGLGQGDGGINITNAFALYVDSCTITGFTQFGIYMNVSSGSTISMTNSTVIQNANIGILLTGFAGNSAKFDIDHCHIENNVFYNLALQTGSRGTIRDSRVSGGQKGIDLTVAVGTAVVQIENCTVTRNATGISAATSSGGTATARVSNCLIANNALGVNAADAGSSIYTRANNTLIDNTTDGTFTTTYSAH